MREYKFRGKFLDDTSDWLYGSYVYIEDDVFHHKIADKNGLLLDIDINTLGQYTGLKDKNGQEIYEGDILLAPEWFGKLKCICIYQQENTVNPIQGFGLYSYDTYFQKYNTLVESDEWDEFEKIGNIYDNPELLEKGE